MLFPEGISEGSSDIVHLYSNQFALSSCLEYFHIEDDHFKFFMNKLEATEKEMWIQYATIGVIKNCIHACLQHSRCKNNGCTIEAKFNELERLFSLKFDDTENNLFHILPKSENGWDAFLFLLEKYPEGVIEPDARGFRPLHGFIEWNGKKADDETRWGML